MVYCLDSWSPLSTRQGFLAVRLDGLTLRLLRSALAEVYLLLHQRLCLLNVSSTRGSKYDRLHVRKPADIRYSLWWWNRTRRQHRHGDGSKLPFGERPLIEIDPAAHPEANFVDVGTNDRVLDTDILEQIQHEGHIHCDKAWFRPVVLGNVRGENAKRLFQPQPHEKVGHHVLQENYGRVEARKHLHFSIDEQPHNVLNIFFC